MVQPGDSWSPTGVRDGTWKTVEKPRCLDAYRPQSAKTLTNLLFLSLRVADAFSPTKGNTRSVKKLEDRKTDPLSLEGYVSSSLPKPPEKGKGECQLQCEPFRHCSWSARQPAWESPGALHHTGHTVGDPSFMVTGCLHQVHPRMFNCSLPTYLSMGPWPLAPCHPPSQMLSLHSVSPPS